MKRQQLALFADGTDLPLFTGLDAQDPEHQPLAIVDDDGETWEQHRARCPRCREAMSRERMCPLGRYFQ